MQFAAGSYVRNSEKFHRICSRPGRWQLQTLWGGIQVAGGGFAPQET